jgi:hypothetical protein
MQVYQSGIEVISNINGELIKGVIIDVHKTAGIFVQFEKPVPCSLGFETDRAWVKVPDSEYQEINHEFSTQPIKRYVIKSNM